MQHHDLMDVLVAFFTFANTLAGALIGLTVMRRQKANTQTFVALHEDTKSAIANVTATMQELHKK